MGSEGFRDPPDLEILGIGHVDVMVWDLKIIDFGPPQTHES